MHYKKKTRTPANSHRHLLIILLSAFLFTSCAQLQTPESLPDMPSVAPIATPANTWEERVDRLNKVHAWTVQGGLSIRTPEDANSASLYWQQKNDQFKIRLLGPVGVGQMQINGGPGAVTLRTSDGKTASATTPEGLLLEQTGWQIPIRNLLYWVRGLPNPNFAANKQLDNQQRIQTLQQDGWHITYEGYQNVKGYELPKKLYLTNGDLRVTIVIRSWKI